MAIPVIRLIPVFRLIPLDDLGQNVCDTVLALPRYRYFFRCGAGECATVLTCRVGRSASLATMSTEGRECPEVLWLLVGDDLESVAWARPARTVLLIPGPEPAGEKGSLTGFVRFVLESLLASQPEHGLWWWDLGQSLLTDKILGVAIPSVASDQALSPAFDGVAVIPREGRDSLDRILSWSGELLGVATTASRVLMMWAGQPAEVRMTLHLFPFLWRLGRGRSRSTHVTFCRNGRDNGSRPTPEI